MSFGCRGWQNWRARSDLAGHKTVVGVRKRDHDRGYLIDKKNMDSHDTKKKKKNGANLAHFRRHKKHYNLLKIFPSNLLVIHDDIVLNHNY